MNERTAEHAELAASCIYCGRRELPAAGEASPCPYCAHPVEGRAKLVLPKLLRQRDKAPPSLWFAAIWLSLIAAVSLMGFIFVIVDWSIVGSVAKLVTWLATAAFFTFLALGVVRGWKSAHKLLSFGWGTAILFGLSLLSGGIDRVIAGLLFIGPVLLCVNSRSAREFLATRSMKRF